MNRRAAKIRSLTPDMKIEPTTYRTRRLRNLSRHLRVYGGIEGRYRQLVALGLTLDAVAAEVGMTRASLRNWIWRWNRKAKEGKGDAASVGR